MKNKLVVFLFLISFNVFSQDFNVQSAGDAYKDIDLYAKTFERRLKDFTDAKKYIDLAAENEQTANSPKMWYYRSLIYLEMDRDTNEAIRNLDPDAIEKSAVSFTNCLKTDTKKKYTEECEAKVWISGLRAYNKGISALNKGDVEKAARYFNLTISIIPLDKESNLKQKNITPDIINYNLARAAMKGKDNAKAKEYLQRLIDVKYNDPMVYLFMDRIYLEEKDTAKALTYIDQGRKIFSDNSSLLKEEISIYSSQGKIDALIVKFTDAINLDPDIESLYFNRASLYDSKGDFANAEADYKKAIELKPEYLDANYWLGNLYFGKAAAILKAASSKSNAEFDRDKKEAEGYLKKAATYLETAMDVNPKKTDDEKTIYKSTLSILKQSYARTGEMEKYNKIKALLEQN